MENIEFAYRTEPKVATRYKLTQFNDDAFLKIWIMRRRHPEVFVYVDTSYFGDIILVDINDKNFNAFAYLDQFGCVERIGAVRIWDTVIDYEFSEYDKVNDLDYTEFTITE